MIAGTSSGGLITAMITTRTGKDSQNPPCDATEVVKFFERDAARIFPTKYK
jgi:patatin-like phospholipase/acyl hydrolase